MKIEKIMNKIGLAVFKNYRLKNDFKPLENLFYKALHPNFFFIQIGANDGVSFDPIYKLVTKEKVKGIAIEPVTDIFEKLKKNYKKHQQVKLLNLAIHKDQSEMKLYRVNPLIKEYPDWTKGTPSFNKSHHKLSNILEKDIVEETVKCISLNELVDKYSIQNIDLLQIDTEGYDSEIIKMIDFKKINPSIISFEHGMKQGIMTYKQFEECQILLLANNYNIIILENDAIAYKCDL
jgi:FkbM family methyltransferase